jgi:hypothetical protein
MAQVCRPFIRRGSTIIDFRLHCVSRETRSNYQTRSSVPHANTMRRDPDAIRFAVAGRRRTGVKNIGHPISRFAHIRRMRAGRTLVPVGETSTRRCDGCTARVLTEPQRAAVRLIYARETNYGQKTSTTISPGAAGRLLRSRCAAPGACRLRSAHRYSPLEKVP